MGVWPCIRLDNRGIEHETGSRFAELERVIGPVCHESHTRRGLASIRLKADRQ